MRLRKLGGTDIEVSPVAMGCWAIVGDKLWGPQDESDTRAAFAAALDAGVNFFDTAEAYGDGFSEEVVGKAMQGIRDRVVIATKASPNHHAPEDLRGACEASLRRLRTDYIDLYQLHWPSREVGFADTWEMMMTLQQQGKIRAAGVSNFGAGDLDGLLQAGCPASNQVCYNLLFRAVEFEIQPRCARENISIICYSPLMQGLLTGKFPSADDVPEGRARSRHFSGERPLARHGEAGCEEETFRAIRRIRAICDRVGAPMADAALAWLLAQEGVASVIAGMRNAAQAKQNALAAEPALPADVVGELTTATDDLKEALGPNADMWQSESRMA